MPIHFLHHLLLHRNIRQILLHLLGTWRLHQMLMQAIISLKGLSLLPLYIAKSIFHLIIGLQVAMK